MKVSTKNKQRGVGLIEVLVAILVLAIGVLGYAAMQLTALKAAEDANHRAQATLLAQGALESFMANESAMASYLDVDNWPDQTIAPGKTLGSLKDCIDSTCTPDDVAEWDISVLAWQAANLLPGGMITVDECKHATDMSCVLVSWNQQTPDDCMTDTGVNTDEGTSCVVMEVSR
ncbi:type IV pilus modification protein PilV [Alcanivorax sp. DP30]|uniref:type IV pilus modification protein PilV n=1 Tax=Alcanivorax sp. DP30 TaxID=2606217 RepID=UPI001369AC79|nr:type IV pilus modification protein PilV [Alcanivorax sp. DP30]MZR61358.1 type IV pilus modification protein PilV [Alcanivorax sp. DP30]